ncbi:MULTISPECIES: type II secretion system minor pseudopilin GspI [Neptunomonas]|nr:MULTISPECIES: type II secretion system minor pseudopilin GspI [Neptunomonas]
MAPSNSQRGFTLLEVMVAIFILAVAAAALSRAAGQSTQTVAALEIRQHATWVAQNQLALVLLETEQQLDGEVTFAGFDFYWKASKAATELADFQRITVDVSTAEQRGYILTSLTGYRHRD